MSRIKWSYKTVHFELKREGLLGGSFLDETEIEEQLNDFGRSGWELISVIEVQDGIIAFFKQSLDFGLSALAAEKLEAESDGDNEAGDVYPADEVQENDDVYEVDEVQEIDDVHEAAEIQEIDDVYEADEVHQADDVYDDKRYQAEDGQSTEFVPYELDDSHQEEEEFADQEDGAYAPSVSEDDHDEFVEEPQQEYEDQESSDEQQEYHNHRGIGAIRIE